MMKKYKEWLPVAGMALILLILTAVLFFSIRGQPDPGREPEPEATTERREEIDEDTTQRERQQRESNDDGDSIKVHGTGHLYYLDPEDEQTFERKLTRFIRKQDIDAGSAVVLEYHVDDRKKETEPSRFFLELDDKEHTIIQCSFEKRTGAYRFSLYDGRLPEGSREICEEEKEIPESTEDVTVPESRLSITDPEGQLEEAADMKELKIELERFLRSEEEGRRNFYVSSVTANGKGYEAVLCFETVRQDGRNVEVTYNGKYHFRFV